MAGEFRFVVKDVDVLKQFNLNSTRARDITDFYLTRTKRVRYYAKTNKESEHFVLIVAEPGSRIKKNKAITQREVNELIKASILTIEKRGIGHITVLDKEGYAEHIKVFIKKSKVSIIDEIQIEFEESEKIIPALIRDINPTKIIRKGLFDYVQKVISDKTKVK